MKAKLNLSIDVDVIKAAKQQGLNMSLVAERAIRAEFDLPDSAERAQAKKKNPDKLWVNGLGWVPKDPIPFKTKYPCEFKQSKEETTQ